MQKLFGILLKYQNVFWQFVDSMIFIRIEQSRNQRRQGSIPKETPWKTLALNERCGYAPRIQCPLRLERSESAVSLESYILCTISIFSPIICSKCYYHLPIISYKLNQAKNYPINMNIKKPNDKIYKKRRKCLSSASLQYRRVCKVSLMLLLLKD